MHQRLKRFLLLCLAWSLGGCGTVAMLGYEPGKTSTGVGSLDPLSVMSERLLETDKAFAARSVETSAAQAFRAYLDSSAVQLPVEGGPVVGIDAIAGRLEQGAPFVLSWQPQYAEVFAPGDWGWTWGEWQAHEPGVGGRRLSAGKYLNIWKKQPDGTWKVRLDMGSQQAKP